MVFEQSTDFLRFGHAVLNYMLGFLICTWYLSSCLFLLCNAAETKLSLDAIPGAAILAETFRVAPSLESYHKSPCLCRLGLS